MKKIILLLLLVSCEPQELAIFNVDAVIIDRTNTKEFIYSDLSNPYMGWEKRANGKIIDYYFKNDSVFVTSKRPFTKVHKMNLGSKEWVKPISQHEFEFPLADSLTTFRIYY